MWDTMNSVDHAEAKKKDDSGGARARSETERDEIRGENAVRSRRTMGERSKKTHRKVGQ